MINPDSTNEFQGTKKRKKRHRRRTRNKNVINERVEVHRQSSEDFATEMATEAEAKRRIELIQNASAYEKEAFISNIPFSVDAKDLVQFIQDKLGSMMSSEATSVASIVSCRILAKQTQSRGMAVVVFKTREAFEQFRAMGASLVLQGRTLNVREGDGKNNRHRPSRTPITTYDARKFQTGYPRVEAAPLPSAFMTSWEHSDDSLSLTIGGTERALTLSFKFNQVKYRVEHKIINVRDLCLERDEATDKLVLAFRVTEAPRVFAEEHSMRDARLSGSGELGLNGGGGDAFGSQDGGIYASELMKAINQVSLYMFRGMTRDKLFWSMEDYGHAMFGDDNWVRTIDPTPANALGICFFYRVFLGITADSTVDKKFSDILHDLKAWRCLRGTSPSSSREFKVNIAPCLSTVILQPISVPSFLGSIKSHTSVSFNVLYWLHCVVAANKVDLEASLLNHGRDLAQTIASLSPLQLVISILSHIFGSPNLPFVGCLHKAVLEYAAGDDANDANLSNEDEVPLERLTFNEEGLGVSSVLMRRVLVTPTRICPQPPEPEDSNRVLRHFKDHIDRFLRVTFVDENFGSFFGANSDDVIERRLRVVVSNGIVIVGQVYKFLAYSNSQIREQSCWFYDETPRGSNAAAPSAVQVRQWIGDIEAIRSIGKYAARLGQGFSSTTPTIVVPPRNYKMVEDVERNGFCFSDGVGVISDSAATRIAVSLNLPPDKRPSAFQIRYGGAKGMLTVMPDAFLGGGHEVWFRRSMMKFESTHQELGINKCARRMPFYLNQQLIAILSARGVLDSVFLSLLRDMTDRLDEALENASAAISLLYDYCGVGYDDDVTASPVGAAYRMLCCGILVTEPYIFGILVAVRNKLLLKLQTKARILVPLGVCLLGVMDETRTLQEGEVFVQLSRDRDRSRPYGLLTDLCSSVIVGRSPSLHPGDVRILVPRDVPALRHLFDVVVFPATGARPHANQMSGGDLDGDLFYISWDSRLIPASDYPAMDYSASSQAPKSTSSPDGVTAQEMGNFYVDYIKNDNLGRIANAWMAWADFSGADSHQCLQLAALHSTAVDFAKTGIPATFPISLKPPKYPHFMNNAYKAQYESSRVLGQIYSIAKCMKIHTNRFDPHVTLNRSLLHPCYDLTEFLDLSHALMVEYNERLWGIMSHYGVGDEMEALSGFVSQFSRRAAPGDRGGNDVQARLNKAVKGLLIEFRDAFWDSVAEDEGDDGSPSSRAMAIASSWYYCAYSQRHENGIEPLISFPWVVYDILCAVKTAHDESV